MYWLVLCVGVALLLMALVTLATRGVAPTRKVASARRMRMVPFMVLVGVGCLLESIPHLLVMSFTASAVAGLVGAVLVLAGSVVMYRLR